jgi:hypothetical protein
MDARLNLFGLAIWKPQFDERRIMNRLVFSCCVVVMAMMFSAIPSIASAQGDDDPTVFIIEGSKGAIGEKDTARIEVGGISGTWIETVIDGPAKLKRANIVTMKDGQIPIGAMKVELNILPTGKGVVTVKVTSKSPTSPTPEVKTYKIIVK